jgi:hypothetical protein
VTTPVQTLGLAVAGTSLFYIDGLQPPESLKRISTDGTAATTLVSFPANVQAAGPFVADGFVYWSEYANGGKIETRLQRQPVDGSAGPTLVAHRDAAPGLFWVGLDVVAIDGGDLIIAETTTTSPTFRLQRRARASDDPETPVETIHGWDPVGLRNWVAVPGAVVVLETGSAVARRVPFDGSPPATIAVSDARVIASDGAQLFVLSYKPQLSFIDIATGQTTRTLNTRGLVSAVHFDATSVYWSCCDAGDGYLAKVQR